MRIRHVAALPVAGLTLILLTGCSGSPAPTKVEAAPPVDLCALAAPPGAVSDAIVVKGEVGAPASVNLPGPLTITGAERTVVVEGGGEKLDGASLVDYAMTVFDAASGEQVRVQGYDGAPSLPVPAATVGQFVGCATVGSRVVVAAPATDQEAASVWVVDVLGSTPARATGADQEPVDGMPKVDLAESGAPIVTVPGEQPPAENQVAVLKKGDGAVVVPGDTVMVQYAGLRWSDGTVFDSSWTTGAPTALVTTDVIEGYKQALEGHSVGSQVLVVIPPAEAYGEGEINEIDLTGETLVFVVDILDTTQAG
ncbi:FKBP-type peptidyl-prolyl cis-trans isomerase [Microbacterium trichothecenolyticum]|uniref:FKBP-type peptidyl-prolyl cis-trans isomerase n=1 Tax=Microbacterium trichothecenolyticum TaxID=69370 RepID=UPI001C6E81FE|nr:FKBP-type peptidyl-prolyl cis-trans isomerase [Microbacterium trichothecenolyticum]MBW9121232.1 FKBP-type peptidyl-prolyl cis-trans isomerase [Microbacterium trichothecenolyticum]